ncbi:MAG TPA: O-antigen ligase family protein [Pirellulales bacterium]|nr:O-antigen ligase family protein [Pirellulales bacterium]
MNQVRVTYSAMAALFILAVTPSYGWAAVVVLSNRTPHEVRFVLADEEQDQTEPERPYALGPDEVRTLRISFGTNFWFADDPENGYRLRGGCAYAFFRSSPDRPLELHRLGLANEQAWLDDETQAKPDGSERMTDSDGPRVKAGEPGSGRERGPLVQVTLAFDVSEPVDVDRWQRELSATLEEASRVTSSQCGVGFQTTDFQIWRSGPSVADFDAAWQEFVSDVPPEPGKLVLGFTTRTLPNSTCSGFPKTAGPLTSHLLAFAGRTPANERERLQNLLHALGHCLGAAHSPESDSLMRSAIGRGATDSLATIRFDPINALAMALVGEEFVTRAPRSLAELDPRLRRRLASVYGTLAEAVPHDPLADRFLRLLSVAAVDPASRQQSPPSTTSTARPHAEGASTKDAVKLPTQSAVRTPLDDQNQTDPTVSWPHDSAENADRAEAKSTLADRSDVRDEPADSTSESDFLPEPFGRPKALGLALVLVGIPAAILGWHLRCGRRVEQPTDGQDARPPTWHAMQSVDRAAWSGYLATLAGATLVSAAAMSPGEGGGLKAGSALLLAGMATMTVAPLYPILGPLVYLGLSYAVQGEDPAAVRIDHSGVLAYLPVLAMAALGLRLFRERRYPRPPRGGAIWVLLAMMAWIGLTAAVAAVDGPPVSSNLVHRTARFAQVLVLFLVTLYADIGLAELRLTSLVLALALFVRVHVFRADVSLEQNLAMLAAIVSPLLFVSAQTAPSRLAKIAFYLLLAYLVVLIVYIQNRAAMLALPAAAAVLLLSSRHRRRALLIAVPGVAALAVWLPSSGLVDRFGEIHQEGEFQGSAYWRLRIWTAGWQIARDHPALGIGPGNFELVVGEYDHRLSSIPPHNSSVQMAAETGLPGAATYVAFLLAASVQLASNVRRRDDWRGCVAGGVLASLAAHVVTGFFLENPSLAATYVALGLGLAVGGVPVTHVYRERLYLPLPDWAAQPLAELVVRAPRVLSGMPVSEWAIHFGHQPPDEIAEMSAQPSGQDLKSWLGLLLAMDLLVTVAGSLAPFSFRPLGLHAAIDLYRERMSRAIEFSDRSDWLANLLLFVPLGFLALAACRAGQRSAGRPFGVLAASVFVLAACLSFSGAIELAQVWFPSRTVNPNDVAAETLGAAAGVVGFLLFGERLLKLAATFFAGRNPLRASEKLLLCYAAGVIAYAAWPFDFTINPTDFASKLREGRIEVTDWARPGWFAAFALSAALMAPIGVLLTTLAVPRGKLTRGWLVLIGWGLAWVLTIEFCRLLAFSQSVGPMHLAGGAAGVLLGGAAGKLVRK